MAADDAPDPLDQDRDAPARSGGRGQSSTPGQDLAVTAPKNPLDKARAPLSLRLEGNKRAGVDSPRVRSRRKSRSFRVR
jgi:hypothetical protein